MDKKLKDELRKLLDEDDGDAVERILRKLDDIEKAIRAQPTVVYPVYPRPYWPEPYVSPWRPTWKYAPQWTVGTTTISCGDAPASTTTCVSNGANCTPT